MHDSLSSESPATTETTETTETLRQRVETLEAEIAAMRPMLFKVAEARMCRDMATMIESCPFCTLKRGGEHGYSGKHDAKCLVTQARLLGF
jgi:predicted nucleic acid binding AN1-type Zn finger protein